MRNIWYHPAAREDAMAGVAWYLERSPLAAQGFLRELKRSVDRISNSPDALPLFHQNTRRCIVQKYPYSVIYRVVGDDIDILAIAHQRRSPDYWKSRVAE